MKISIAAIRDGKEKMITAQAVDVKMLGEFAFTPFVLYEGMLGFLAGGIKQPQYYFNTGDEIRIRLIP